MRFDLQGARAMVTGAAQGLGLALSRALAEAGAAVLMVDVNEEGVESARSLLHKEGGQVSSVAADVSVQSEVARIVDLAVARYGGLDVLVNAAGVTSNSPFEDLQPSDWERVFAVNVTGTFHCCQQVGRRMLQAGRGSIINVASISGLVGNRGGNNTHYCASKGAVIALTRSLAVEWGPRGVRVNAVAPGYFRTPMTDRIRQRSAAVYDEFVARVPLGRFGAPEELTGPVLFLASDASSYVTGHVLIVDGGYTAW